MHTTVAEDEDWVAMKPTFLVSSALDTKSRLDAPTEALKSSKVQKLENIMSVKERER